MWSDLFFYFRRTNMEKRKVRQVMFKFVWLLASSVHFKPTTMVWFALIFFFNKFQFTIFIFVAVVVTCIAFLYLVFFLLLIFHFLFCFFFILPGFRLCVRRLEMLISWISLKSPKSLEVQGLRVFYWPQFELLLLCPSSSSSSHKSNK